jgi:hypothetical protein
MNQEVKVNVYKLSGQLLNTRSQILMPGQHRFTISFPETGIYNVSLLKNNGSLSFKAVNLKPTMTKCFIEYRGTEYQNKPNFGETLNKKLYVICKLNQQLRKNK